jgi:hypothetical protein
MPQLKPSFVFSVAALLIALATGIAGGLARAELYEGSWTRNADGSSTILAPRYLSSGGYAVGISYQTPGENVCRLFRLKGFLRVEFGDYDPKRMVCNLTEDGQLKSCFDGDRLVYESITCARPL